MNVSYFRGNGNGNGLCSPPAGQKFSYIYLRLWIRAYILSSHPPRTLFLVSLRLLSLPTGGGCWRKSAPGDGERLNRPGQGRGAGLCPAGKLQQWGSLHREPPETLQRKPHLRNEAIFFLHFFQNILLGVETYLNVFSCFGSDVHWDRKSVV